MGREIRMVPANWDHPKQIQYGDNRPQPMHDESFEDKFAEWLKDFDRVRRGDLTEIERECFPLGLAEWLCDEGQPPDPQYYRPWKDGEGVWVQVWETVSEGTPVTPPFATKAELVDYLVADGDFWDQKRGDGGWNRKNAEAFVNSRWAPSMTVIQSAGKAEIFGPRDGVPA